MAKSSKFRHNPDLGKTDVTDPLHSEFSKDTDIILINDGKVGINLERNIIGALGSRDPEHTLHVSGDANIEGPFKVGGDISGDKNVEIKGSGDIEGSLSVSGGINTSGSIEASGDISTLGKISTDGDLEVGGDIKTTGEWDVSGNARFHADVFVKDDLRVSGDFHVREDHIVGDPTSGLLASFSGREIIFGEKESGQLVEFNTGVQFFVRPTVSGSGVLLKGEGTTMGDTNIANLNVQDDLVVSGNLFVSGETTVQNITDVSITGDISGHTGRFNKLFTNGGEVIDVSDTGNFYPRLTNPSGYITRDETGNFILNSETGDFVTTGYSGLVEIASGDFTKQLTISGNPVLTGVAGGTASASPFCFFYDAINHNGIIQKTYYEARVQGKENLMLSGVLVDDASDLTLKLRFDGPDNDYVGTGFINDVEIETGNLSEHGSETRRFNGFIRGDFAGLNGFVTGKANDRESVLTLTELGGGPEATALYIDEIANSTPKADTNKGLSALKENDQINIFAEFDTSDVTEIKVDGHGLAKEKTYQSYSLSDIGGGKYKATIPVVVSSNAGNQPVRVFAKNSFGTEGEGILSNGFGGTSGERLLDQSYPSASLSVTYQNRWDGSEGLGWNAVTDKFVTGTASLSSISNFNNSTDSYRVSMTSHVDDDRVLIFDGSSLAGPNSEGYKDNTISTFYEQNKKFRMNEVPAHTASNVYAQIPVSITLIRQANGAKTYVDSNLKFRNNPQVLTSGKLDTLAFRSQNPHVIGQSEYKQGDLVSGEFTIYTKGKASNGVKYNIDNSQGWGSGPTSFKNIKDTSSENNAGAYNSYLDAYITGQVGSTSSSLTDLYVKFINNPSSSSDGISYPATGSTVVNNNDVPSFTISSIDYPANQSALNGSQQATVNHTKNSHVDVTAYGNSNSSTQGQLQISSASTFEAAKTVSRQGGSYNPSTNNFTVSGTKNSNGLVTSSSTAVRIANVAPQYTINNLNNIKTSEGQDSTDSFTITANQVLGENAPILDVVHSHKPDTTVSKTSESTTSLDGQQFVNSASYSLTVKESSTKGEFTFNFTGTGIGGQEVTVISTNPNYSISGFAEREVIASPQSLGAGLAAIGTSVSDPSNVKFENISEGISPGVGTDYTYKSYADGTQMTATIDFNDQFTVTDSVGLTSTTGDHVFNLDRENRNANAALPGAIFKIEED